MCTVSWLPGDEGYTIWFNRDERPARPSAPPAIHHGALRYLAPTDLEAGGTWIAVNQTGVTLAITNQYPPHPPPPADKRISRGLLVASWIDSADLTELGSRIEALEAERYAAFSMVACQTGEPAMVVDWNGREVTVRRQADPGFILTSSGAVPPDLERIRRSVFDDFIGRHGLNPEALERAHASHLPERGVLSVCMHRDVAATVSLSVIEVTPDRATFRYTPGPPCVTRPNPPVSLPRETAPLSS